MFAPGAEQTLSVLQQPGQEIHLGLPIGSPGPSPDDIRNMWAGPEAELKAHIDDVSARLRGRLDALPCLQALSALVITTHFHDPETYRESESRYSAFLAEYAAWHYLSATPQPDLVAPVLNSAAMQDAFDLFDDLSVSLKAYYTIRTQVAAASPSTVEEAVLTQARSWHLFVRSPSYEHHNRAQLEALFIPFAAELKGLLGYSVEEVITAESALTRLVGERINDHRRLLAETITEWHAALDADPATVDADKQDLLRMFRDTGDPKTAATVMAMTWAQSTWHTAFIVTPQELAEAARLDLAPAEAILRSFSTPFGQRRRRDDWPSLEEQLEHAPLIDLGDGSSWVGLLTKLQWAIAPKLEAALASSPHWERYQHQHRSRWLEDRAVALIAGPDDRVARWTRLRYGVDDELDGLVLCGGIAILIETKAGRMTLSARRGAPSGLESDLRDLLTSPQQQVNRAAQYLQDNEEAVFETSTGRVVIPRDGIKRIVHVIVTLDSLTAFVSRPAILARAGVFNQESLPWCVDINDLQVCVQILGSPARLAHYIDRRMKAARRRVEAPEELDYLGHYLTRQLYFDEVGEEVYEIVLTSHTEALDDYYRYEAGVRKTSALRPAHLVDPAMARFLEELEASAPANFGEAIFWLLELSTDAQADLARAMEDRRERVRRGVAFSAIRHFVGPRVFAYIALPGDDFRPLGGYVSAAKYAGGATFALGVAQAVSDPTKFAIDAQYSPWEQDDEMDRWSVDVLNRLQSRPVRRGSKPRA